MASTLGCDSRREKLLNTALSKRKVSGVTIADDIKMTPYDEFWEENYQLLEYAFRR
jgi:hypothetical protein